MKAIETLFKEINEYNAKIKFLNDLYEKYFTLRIEDYYYAFFTYFL